jgi:hypothetical protein
LTYAKTSLARRRDDKQVHFLTCSSKAGQTSICLESQKSHFLTSTRAIGAAHNQNFALCFVQIRIFRLALGAHPAIVRANALGGRRRNMCTAFLIFTEHVLHLQNKANKT